MVRYSTDGALAMGSDKGALYPQDATIQQFLSYHGIFNQQVLCEKFLEVNDVMKLVVKIVNTVRAQSLKRRLFKN